MVKTLPLAMGRKTGLRAAVLAPVPVIARLIVLAAMHTAHRSARRRHARLRTVPPPALRHELPRLLPLASTDCHRTADEPSSAWRRIGKFNRNCLVTREWHNNRGYCSLRWNANSAMNVGPWSA